MAQIDPNNITWVDADTFELDGDRYRVEGYDAPEKAGIFVDKEGCLLYTSPSPRDS